MVGVYVGAPRALCCIFHVVASKVCITYGLGNFHV